MKMREISEGTLLWSISYFVSFASKTCVSTRKAHQRRVQPGISTKQDHNNCGNCRNEPSFVRMKGKRNSDSTTKMVLHSFTGIDQVFTPYALLLRFYPYQQWWRIFYLLPWGWQLDIVGQGWSWIWILGQTRVWPANFSDIDFARLPVLKRKKFVVVLFCIIDNFFVIILLIDWRQKLAYGREILQEESFSGGHLRFVRWPPRYSSSPWPFAPRQLPNSTRNLRRNRNH